jgi:hypothetical protein
MNIVSAAPAVNLETERWFPIVGFEKYAVSDWGRVKSFWYHNGTTERFLRLHEPVNGHLYVVLYAGGCRRQMYVHRLVLEAVVGPCPVGQECRHLDGNPGNNHVGNLAWGTHTENMADRVRHGTSNRGVRNGNARLTEDDVVEIRRRLGQGMLHREIASLFGVRQPAISLIKTGKRWAHLTYS